MLGTWTRRREVSDRGCVLVRPDRFVAWRCAGPVDEPTEALRAVMHQVLGLATTDPAPARPDTTRPDTTRPDTTRPEGAPA